MENSFLITISSFFLLLSISCGDPVPEPEPTLPPITNEGKNTIGFLLNGKVWLPEVPFPDLSGTVYLGCGLSRSTNTLVIHTSRYISIRDGVNPARDSVYQVLFISTDKIDRIGIYKIEDYRDAFIDHHSLCSPSDYYDMDTNYLPHLNITHLDLSRQIISGLFEFNLINSSSICNDTISVRDGRFDLKFNWVP